MRRHVLTRTAVLGSFLAFSACDDADTLGGNDTKELVKTASTEQRAPNAEPGNGKAWMFTTPREARILLLATP